MSKFYFVLICMFFFSSFNVSALSLAVRVPEKYIDVVAGERFYFEVEVKYPENPKRKDLRFEYEVLNKDGNLVSQSRALKAIETQASFIDFIVIPEAAEDGFHVINVEVRDYGDLSEEVSSSFYVESSGSDYVIIYLMIILGILILIGALVILSIILKR